MGMDAGFLTMLTMRMTVERTTGTDKWGNETYAAPEVDVRCFVTEYGEVPGTEDGQGSSEGDRVWRATILSDAIGIQTKDRLTIPQGKVVYVTEVDTPLDEDGSALMHTITAETARKG